MSEETQAQLPQTQPAPPVENTSRGDQPKAATLIEQADSAAKRVEDASRKAEETLKRMEELYARQMFAGKTDAGQAPREETIDDKAAKMAEQSLRRYNRF